ncbi:sodium:solute symporter family protein [Candidatus Uabimicrobium sp. HlEnr_7]|uniref:sodium:solute symporter family protein n=1 Tax=Candidatus Uabimicrobium helgolandensis TaxID=3095367 RepID=UPI003556EA7B
MTTIIVIYLVFLFVIVSYTKKYTKTSEDFFLAGRNLNWLVAGGSIVATGIGGTAILGYAGAYYHYGIVWHTMFSTAFISALFFAFFVAERVRSIGAQTLPEILGKFYGGKTSLIGAIMIIASDTIIIALQIKAMSHLFVAFLDIPEVWSTILCAILFTSISLIGGFLGVAITDAIGTLFITIGILWVAVVSMNLAGGFQVEKYLQNFSAISWQKMLGNNLSLFGLLFASQSIIFQRLHSVSTPKDAKKSLFVWAVGLVLIMGISVPLIGFSAREILGENLKPDQVIPTMIKQVLSPQSGAILVAVLIGAIMTSANSMLLSVSMNITKDIAETGFNKKYDDKTVLKMGRVFTVILGFITYIIATYITSLIGTIIFVYTAISALVIPLYSGIFGLSKPLGGFLSLLFGIVSGIGWYLIGQPWEIHPVVACYVCGLIGLIIGNTFDSK